MENEAGELKFIAVERPGLAVKVKPVILPRDYRSTSRGILAELVAEHPSWRTYSEFKMFEFVHAIGAAVPVELEAINRPEHQTERERLEFVGIWFEECAAALGFKLLGMPKRPSKQLTLFD